MIVLYDFYAVGLLTLLVVGRLEEEAEEMTSFTDQIRGLLILLLDTIVSQLLNPNDKHVQLLQSGNGMCDILLGSIKLTDLQTATLHDVLRSPGILLDRLDLLNQHDCLIVDLVELLSCLFLRIGLLLDAVLHFLVKVHQLLIVLLYLTLDVLQRLLVRILVVQELDNVEVGREHRIVQEFLKLGCVFLLFVIKFHLLSHLHQIV